MLWTLPALSLIVITAALMRNYVQAKPARRTGDGGVSGIMKSHRTAQTKEPNRNLSVSLAQALPNLGYCSRSEAREVVAAERVRVNNIVRRNIAFRVDAGADRLDVDGQRIRGEAMPPRLAPVGRPDKVSEGLFREGSRLSWLEGVLDEGRNR